MNMYAFLLCCALCILGRTEGQNCTLPCNWQNKDFQWTVADTAMGFWNFSETTFIMHVGHYRASFECIKIVGRFLIIRQQDTDSLRCNTIETNNADSFTVIINFEIYESDFTNECSACSEPTGKIWRMSAVGTVAQNQTRAECNIPVGCTPGLKAVDPNTCDDNGNIEGYCNEATTHPTTPPPPTTSPATYPQKRCKHGHP